MSETNVNYFSDIIKSILYDKKEDLLDDEHYQKAFNYTALLKIFSNDEKLLPYCIYFNYLLKGLYRKQHLLTKKDIYRLFLKVFPKFHKSYRIQYEKTILDNKYFTKIQEYFSCSLRESFYYEQVLDEVSKNKISQYMEKKINLI